MKTMIEYYGSIFYYTDDLEALRKDYVYSITDDDWKYYNSLTDDPKEFECWTWEEVLDELDFNAKYMLEVNEKPDYLPEGIRKLIVSYMGIETQTIKAWEAERRNIHRAELDEYFGNRLSMLDL